MRVNGQGLLAASPFDRRAVSQTIALLAVAKRGLLRLSVPIAREQCDAALDVLAGVLADLLSAEGPGAGCQGPAEPAADGCELLQELRISLAELCVEREALLKVCRPTLERIKALALSNPEPEEWERRVRAVCACAEALEDTIGEVSGPAEEGIEN